MKIKVEVNEVNQILISVDEILKRVLSISIVDNTLTVYSDHVDSNGRIRKPLGYMLGSNCLKDTNL